MRLVDSSDCPHCGANLLGPGGTSLLIGVEYAYGSPERYDGVSEWMCPNCKTREGRWTDAVLDENEVEPRHGRGGVPVSL